MESNSISRNAQYPGWQKSDIYDSVLQELCAIPSECIAIEDSESGGASAISAGLTCYAIPGLNTAPQSYRSASRVLTDYTELD